jgi:hypothetical protein
VSAEVMGSGPISSINRDNMLVIRRVVQVDTASVAMSVDAGVSKAKPQVEMVVAGSRRVAFAHLEGVGQAGGAVALNDLVVKMAGKCDFLLDPSDDAGLPDFKFGFLQIGSVFVSEDTYVGRTINEGHVKLKHRLKISPNVLLDTAAGFAPFSSRAPTTSSETRGPKKVVHMAVDLGIHPGKKGDSPHSFSTGVIMNRDTNAENFMFEFNLDIAFTTVLVVIDPQKKTQALAHVNWHLVWRTQFKWKGAQNPTATAVPINNRADFGAVIIGAPTDAAVAALVAKPAGQFFNDVTDAAKKDTALGSRPNREDNFSRPAGIPTDFFT